MDKQNVAKKLKVGQCITCKYLKVSDFGGFTVNSNIDSEIYINFEFKNNHEQISQLKYAYINLKGYNGAPPRFFCLTDLSHRLEEQFGIKVYANQEHLQEAIR